MGTMSSQKSIGHVYRAMYFFLEDYYSEHKKPEGLVNLLSSMQINSKNKTMDPACWSDWIDALNQYGLKNKKQISPEEGYNAMCVFIKNYFIEGKEKEIEIKKVLNMLTKDKAYTDTPVFQNWLKKVNYVNKNFGKVKNMIPEKINETFWHLQ